MSHSPVLWTKVHPPRQQARLVERERVLRMLDDIPNRRLTLVSASAGFGKTTAVISWLQRSGWKAAWVSLDAADNDTVRFITYVVTALRTVAPQLGEGIISLLGQSAPPATSTLMEAIINDAAALDEPILLVLDDYQVIINPEIHSALLYLVEHAPDQLRVLLTTRADPAFPVAKLRVRNHLLEVRADALRFDGDETASLFEQTLSTPLRRDQIEALLGKTEGWVAGLQMAGISMRSHSDVTAFIEAFTGADRFVLEYLLEEVLAGLPEGIQRMMLSLSILDRFCGELCDAVTGWKDCAVLLEQLEDSNLFLVPLDDRREWYRYHKLFGDLLLHRLNQTRADELPEMYSRAAGWFEERGLIVEAVQYAGRSGDHEYLRAMVDRNWLQLMRDGGRDQARIVEDQLTREEALARPGTGITLAWLEFSGRRYEHLEETLDATERSLALDPEATDRDDLIAHALYLRASSAADKGDSRTGIAYGERALSVLPARTPDSPKYLWFASRGAVLTVLGSACDAARDYDRAIRYYLQAIRYGRSIGDRMCVASSLARLASLHMGLGNLDKALGIAEDLLAHGREPEYQHIQSVPREIRARVSFERGELDAAAEEIAHALSFPVNPIQEIGLLRLSFQLAEIRSDLHSMEQSLEAIERLPKPVGARFLRAIPACSRVSYFLCQVDVDAAARELEPIHELAAELSSIDASAVEAPAVAVLMWYRVAAAQLAIAQGSPEAALDHLDRQLALNCDHTLRTSCIVLLVLRAVALGAMQQADRASESLCEAIRLAAPERIVRPFLAERQAVGRLLRNLLHHRRGAAGLSADFLRHLASVCQVDEVEYLTTLDAARARDGAGLTPREREILSLLVLGYSNQRIAQKLYVSVNTIKTHLSNLFDKLEVGNRIEAVAKARQMDEYATHG